MLRLRRRKVAGQLGPLSARFNHIRHRTHHPPPFILARPASGVTLASGLRKQRFKPGPLHIRQITRIHQPKLSQPMRCAYSFLGSSVSFWTDSKNFEGHLDVLFLVMGSSKHSELILGAMERHHLVRISDDPSKISGAE